MVSGLFEYQPGSARLVVSANRGVLTPDVALAARLWPLIARGTPFSGLLEEALLDGLAHLPDLILFEFDAHALRVVVRGKLAVRVQSADGGTAECDGQLVRTWNEQVFARPVLVTAGEPTGTGLPLGSGSVLAAGFRWAAEGTTTGVRSSEENEVRTPIVAEAASRRLVPAVDHIAPVAPTAVAVPDPVASSTSSPGAPPMTRSELPDTRIEPIDDSFEHLFESTVMRSVEDAAVRAPEEELSVVAVASTVEPSTSAPQIQAIPGRAGDHDGSTIMAGQLAALCDSTGDPIPPPGATVRAPTLRLSSGQSVVLDRSVVIGRRPQVDRVSGSEIPHLVTVPSPQQDISRSHVAIRPGGAGWVAVDLGSTNGSVIRRAGGATAALANGAVLDLQPGDTIDLGDGVTAVLLAPS